MSEPLTFAVSIDVPAEGLRAWLAAPLPPPDCWTDWKDLGIILDPSDFDLARRRAGKTAATILNEWAGYNRDSGGWHFTHCDGRLEIVILQGAESWREHLLILVTLRLLEGFGARDGAAMAHDFIFDRHGTAWTLAFPRAGRVVLAHETPAFLARITTLVDPILEAARNREAGAVTDDFNYWRGR